MEHKVAEPGGRTLGSSKILALWALAFKRIYVPAVFVIFGFLWEFLRDPVGVPSYILPTPSEIASALYRLHGFLLDNTWITLRETLSGFLVATVLALTMTILISIFTPLRRVLYPTTIALNAVPKVAIAPLLVVWFGVGLVAKVAMSFFISFFPIFINAMAGLEQVDPDHLQLMNSLKASKFRILYEIRLPNSLPFIFEGLKIAMPLAMIGAIVGEFIGASSGLGYVLITAQSALNTPVVFAALIWITAISMVLFWLVAIARKFVIRWERK